MYIPFLFFAGGGNLEVGAGLLQDSCGGGFLMSNSVGSAFQIKLFLLAVINCESSKWFAHIRKFSCNSSDDFPSKSALLRLTNHLLHLCFTCNLSIMAVLIGMH